MDTKKIKLNYSGLFSLLQKNGMNRNALVKRVGLTHNAILSIKKGEPIAMSALMRICAYFHCDVSDVFKIEFDPVDNRNYFFAKITEALEGSDNKQVLLQRQDDTAVFWIADAYGYAAYPIANTSLDIANHVTDLNDLRDIAVDTVKQALFTADKINPAAAVLTAPPESTGHDAIDLKDGHWYNCNGPIE